jgi:hypothetical protein
MSIRIQYFILMLGLFIATFLIFFLLGDDIIDSIKYAMVNTCAFLILCSVMILSGRWSW